MRPPSRTAPPVSAAEWAVGQLGYAFEDPALLAQALTHKSASRNNYERLEFLGDRVLGLTMASWLYQRFPKDTEGQLNTRYARLVSRVTCAKVARSVHVDQQLVLGAQALADGGTDSDNILGDVTEALIGAVWLEAGPEVAQKLVHKLWGNIINHVGNPVKHPKSAVQEWAAAHGHTEPVYRLLARSGPEHHPLFQVALEIADFPPVTAEGHSKQDAETHAANLFLDTHAS